MKRHMLRPGKLVTLCGKEGSSLWTEDRAGPSHGKSLPLAHGMLSAGNYIFMLEAPGAPMSCGQCYEALKKMGLAKLTADAAAVRPAA